MSSDSFDDIRAHAERALMNRWSLTRRAAATALVETSSEIGVALDDLAALVVAAGPGLRLAEEHSGLRGQRAVYGSRERPLVEVEVDGIWCRGRLCYQMQGPGDEWWMRVTYRRPGDQHSYLGKFAAHQVRRPTIDRLG